MVVIAVEFIYGDEFGRDVMDVVIVGFVRFSVRVFIISVGVKFIGFFIFLFYLF